MGPYDTSAKSDPPPITSAADVVASTIESTLSVLQAIRAKPFDPLGVGDLDRPALPLEGVVDELGPVIDSIAPQTGSAWASSIRRASPSQRFWLGQDGELIEMLPLVGEQADVNIPSTEV